MDEALYRGSPIGRLEPISGVDARTGERYDHFAFVPAPLPRELVLSAATYTVVAEAMHLIGKLDAAVHRLPNPLLLARPALRQEAVSTSALEGTHANFREVLEAETASDRLQRPEVREVLNFVRAAEYAVTVLPNRAIGQTLLGEVHAILMQGTRGDSPTRGRLRNGLVVIGDEDGRVEDARFVPPPHTELPDGIDRWEEWIHRDGDDIPLLVRIAVGHYQFETLHPYNDGNGRLGRLVCLLQLIDAGVLRVPVMNLSPWLERRRTQYQDHLAATSASGDFDPWVRFFVEAVKSQAASALDKVERLVSLSDEMTVVVRAAGLRGSTADLAGQLIGYPVLSVKDAAGVLGVTYQTANVAVAKLLELGLLEQIGDGNYDRLFMCVRAYDVLENRR